MEPTDTTSNDNSPPTMELGGFSDDEPLNVGDAIGFHRFAQEKAYANVEEEVVRSHFETKEKPFRKAGVMGHPVTFIASLCLWVMYIVATYQVFQTSVFPVINILVLVINGWVALFFAYVCKYQEREFFRDLGLSGVIGTLMASVMVALMSFNLPVDLASLCGGFAILTAILAALVKERYLLTVSCMAALSWTAYSLLNLQISTFIWAFPIIWVIQMSLAAELKAKIPLVLASLSGLFWLIGNVVIITTAAKISPLMAICAVFAAGFTYSRIGKSMQDNQILGALFQTNVGWAVAAICALLLQDYWLMSTPHMPWTNLPTVSAFAYPMTAQWSAMLIFCILVIGSASLLRMRKGRQSLPGGLGILLFSTILPASIAFKPQMISYAEQYGVQATPSFGLIIGGAITALSLGMLVNGLRRSKPSMMLLALITLSMEAVIVMDNLYSDPNNLALFGSAVLVMTLTAGLYAHNGKTQEQSGLIHA